MININPLGDLVVIQALEQYEVTPSGIVLPDKAKEKPQEGEDRVGPGKVLENGTRQEMEVKVGDRDLFQVCRAQN